MLAEGLEFSQNLASSPCKKASWSRPQLITSDLLLDCKGPDAEWLVRRPESMNQAEELGTESEENSEAACPDTGTAHQSVQSIVDEERHPKCTSVLSSPSSSPVGMNVLFRNGHQGLERFSASLDLLTPYKNPVFDSDCNTDDKLEADFLPYTPEGCTSYEVQAALTPGTVRDQVQLHNERQVRVLEPARSLEAQLLSARPSANSIAALQELQGRLDVAVACNAQLREEKGVHELKAAVLQDEVQLSIAALEASQHARREAELQLAQALHALQHASAEHEMLLNEVETSRKKLQEAYSKMERLEYLLELSRDAEREKHTSHSFSLTPQPDPPAGFEMVAEVHKLQAALAEANSSKAVLAAKLHQCKADNAQLVGRLQASQSRHAADISRLGATTQLDEQEMRGQIQHLQEDRHKLMAQVRLLQRQASASNDCERSYALAGVVRQREEQLVQAHMQLAQLQAQVQELLDSEKRCGVLVSRLALVDTQMDTMANKMHAAQQESKSWRESLGHISDELAACTLREAQAKSALLDTADKLLVQQQMFEAQEQELELLRRELERVNCTKLQVLKANSRGLDQQEDGQPHSQLSHEYQRGISAGDDNNGNIIDTGSSSIASDTTGAQNDCSARSKSSSRMSWLKGLRHQH